MTCWVQTCKHKWCWVCNSPWKGHPRSCDKCKRVGGANASADAVNRDTKHRLGVAKTRLGRFQTFFDLDCTTQAKAAALGRPADLCARGARFLGIASAGIDADIHGGGIGIDAPMPVREVAATDPAVAARLGEGEGVERLTEQGFCCTSASSVGHAATATAAVALWHLPPPAAADCLRDAAAQLLKCRWLLCGLHVWRLYPDGVGGLVLCKGGMSAGRRDRLKQAFAPLHKALVDSADALSPMVLVSQGCTLHHPWRTIAAAAATGAVPPAFLNCPPASCDPTLSWPIPHRAAPYHTAPHRILSHCIFNCVPLHAWLCREPVEQPRPTSCAALQPPGGQVVGTAWDAHPTTTLPRAIAWVCLFGITMFFSLPFLRPFAPLLRLYTLRVHRPLATAGLELQFHDGGLPTRRGIQRSLHGARRRPGCGPRSGIKRTTHLEDSAGRRCWLSNARPGRKWAGGGKMGRGTGARGLRL